MVVAYKAVNDLICVLHDLRVAEIELPAAAVVHLFAVACEEPVRVYARGLRAANAHYFNFEPHARNHALRADVVHHFLKAVRETFLTRQPFAHVVPPEAVRVPACVHAEVFAARLVRRIDERQLFRRCRVAPQAVHVVVENDAQLLVVCIFAANHAAVLRQLAHGVIKFAERGAYAHRHCRECFARLQILPPVRFRFRRAAQLNVKVAHLVADFPVPRAVVLNLPE